MKKNGILNSNISKVLSDLGHTDKIAIADCGLPIPDGIKKIDISLKIGYPDFTVVLDEILRDMKVEKAYLASEIKTKNEPLYGSIMFSLSRNKITNIEYITHEEFKNKLKDVKAVIRTGEATPYANIILQSDVLF